MPYDLYERHAVVSQLLRARLGDVADVHILDVGGRADLLERFLGYRVVSVNPDGSGEQVSALAHLAMQVLKADRLALALPISTTAPNADKEQAEVRVAAVAGFPPDNASSLAVGNKPAHLADGRST